jgi:hypothetical protein
MVLGRGGRAGVGSRSGIIASPAPLWAGTATVIIVVVVGVVIIVIRRRLLPPCVRAPCVVEVADVAVTRRLTLGNNLIG